MGAAEVRGLASCTLVGECGLGPGPGSETRAPASSLRRWGPRLTGSLGPGLPLSLRSPGVLSHQRQGLVGRSLREAEGAMGTPLGPVEEDADPFDAVLGLWVSCRLPSFRFLPGGRLPARSGALSQRSWNGSRLLRRCGVPAWL